MNEGTVLGQDPRGARKKRHWASIAKGDVWLNAVLSLYKSRLLGMDLL